MPDDCAVKVMLPFRGEFGLKVWWHVPAVHAAPGIKVVYIEAGEEALYPSAAHWVPVPRRNDDLRRNTYKKDADFVAQVERDAKQLFPEAEQLRPGERWPRARFVPKPHVRVADISCDVVVAPRKRNYGAKKNWDPWPTMVEALQEEGLEVFAGGAADSSYEVDCACAWHYDRNLDATLIAMDSAQLVLATDAGLAHLAVLCGKPLIMITHGEGLVAPGTVDDEHGRPMEPQYWPVKIERYIDGNHCNAPIRLVHHGWLDPERVLNATLAWLRDGIPEGGIYHG